MKLSLVGTGAIGSMIAHMATGLYTEIVLMDINADKAKGKALDIGNANPATTLYAAERYEDLKSSDVVVVTASVPYVDIAKRDQLIVNNTILVKEIAVALAAHTPDAFVIMITNPVDVMTTLFQQAVNWPTHKLMGLSGTLGKLRFQHALKQHHPNLDVTKVDIPVIGCHWPNGVYLTDQATFKGQPLNDMVDAHILAECAARAADAGAAVMGFLKNDSTAFAPAQATLSILRALQSDTPAQICGSVVTDVAATGHITSLAQGKIQEIHTPVLSSENQVLLSRSKQQTIDILARFPAHTPLAKKA